MLSYWYQYRFGANSNANFLNIQINFVFRFLRIKLIFNLSSIHFYDPYLELWNSIFFKLEHFNVKIIAYPALLCHLEVWFWKHFFPVNIESIINYPSRVNYGIFIHTMKVYIYWLFPISLHLPYIYNLFLIYSFIYICICIYWTVLHQLWTN